LKWDDLKLFLAVSRCGTMSGAAQQLNIQHSTISRRIKSLEKQLGTNLIRREKGRYKLTRAGEKIRDAALKVEEEIAGVDGTLLQGDDPLTGPIRITTINCLATTILMPMFAAFSKLYPQVTLHIMASSNTVNLTNREADVAIRQSNSPPATLIGKRVATVSSAIYGSREYFREYNAGGGDLKWLGVSCCNFHKAWTKQTSGSEVHGFNSDDVLMTLAALREGLGVSYLPCHLGDDEPALRRFGKPDKQFDLGLWILTHPESRSNRRVMTFRDFMIDAIKAQEAAFCGKSM
jgi:DNA-binding transcriptional LysR family regulator